MLLHSSWILLAALVSARGPEPRMDIVDEIMDAVGPDPMDSFRIPRKVFSLLPTLAPMPRRAMPRVLQEMSYSAEDEELRDYLEKLEAAANEKEFLKLKPHAIYERLVKEKKVPSIAPLLGYPDPDSIQGEDDDYHRRRTLYSTDEQSETEKKVEQTTSEQTTSEQTTSEQTTSAQTTSSIADEVKTKNEEDSERSRTMKKQEQPDIKQLLAKLAQLSSSDEDRNATTTTVGETTAESSSSSSEKEIIKDVNKKNLIIPQAFASAAMSQSSCIGPDIKCNIMPVDVMLMIDSSYSMTDSVDELKTQFVDMFQDLITVYPNVRFGIGEIADKPYFFFGEEGRRCWTIHQSPTQTFSVLANAVQKVINHGGGDIFEDSLTGILYAAENPQTSWRDYVPKWYLADPPYTDIAGLKIVLLITDAPPHESPDFSMLVDDSRPPKVIYEFEGFNALPEENDMDFVCSDMEYPTPELAQSILWSTHTNISVVIPAGITSPEALQVSDREGSRNEALVWWKNFGNEVLEQSGDFVIDGRDESLGNSLTTAISHVVRAQIEQQCIDEPIVNLESPDFCADGFVDECGVVVPPELRSVQASLWRIEKLVQDIWDQRPKSSVQQANGSGGKNSAVQVLQNMLESSSPGVKALKVSYAM